MDVAFSEAQIAFADGAVPVGAIIVNELGQVVAKSHNTLHNSIGHAELLAINNASEGNSEAKLRGCTIFTTLEPCIMCAGAILNAQIDCVVFGAWDAKFGAGGSVWDLLRDPLAPSHPQVFAGISEEKCSQILTHFFEKLRAKP